MKPFIYIPELGTNNQNQEIMKNKRKQMEGFVSQHPIFNRVSDYISSNYNIDKEIVYNKLINFFLRECDCITDNVMQGIKCFDYDESKEDFVNKTKYSSFYEF